MQLYALDDSNQLIFAGLAAKHRDYRCLECGTSVRLRGGIHRQDHFYHIEKQRNCRQNQKSLEHINTQLQIQGIFPNGEVTLEHRFTNINRIADVVWHRKKVIFEVQCSPITAEEVEERNRDYGSLGYEVIWILHDKRYNKWRFTAAEIYLRDFPHFYTNINSEGEGGFYDQYDEEDQGVRRNIHHLGKVNLREFVWKRKKKFIKKCGIVNMICSYFKFLFIRPYKMTFEVLLEMFSGR